MKICAYVQEAYAKANYKNECLDTRQFMGLRVIIDCLERAGYQVDYAGIATVHLYDIVLVSLTSDCDWWSFVSEQLRWQKGNYKVLIGGAGVLHVAPFTRWFYAAMFGRGENLIVPLVEAIKLGERYNRESIMYADEFDYNRIWRIEQTETPYQHEVHVNDKDSYREDAIGCNHRCLFCGYTWQRKFVSPRKEYAMGYGLFNIEDKERAMLDLDKDPTCIDWKHLRTTAIDGFSERIRCGVNKRITDRILHNFLVSMLAYEGAPHQLKFYNICGYPTEDESDWQEFLEALRRADKETIRKDGKQWSIVLHSTPFRAMPATPMACASMQKRNYRGLIGRTLGAGLKGGLIYQGKNLWAVESMGTDSLSTVMLSAIAHRGSESDSENIAKLCSTKKFWSASSAIKEATLEKYFDLDNLFASKTPETLPSRYLRTWCPVEKMWGKTPLEIAERNGH